MERLSNIAWLVGCWLVVGAGELVGNFFVWVIATCAEMCIMGVAVIGSACGLGETMSEVVLNCAECDEGDAARIPSGRTTGVVECVRCGAGIDVAHAYAHAPWCLVCGEDVSECVCEGFSCDQCGVSLDGVVCVDCMSCPEPAGYWAWDAVTMSDYLITLDRAAAHYGARGRGDVADVIMAHHAVMAAASGMDEDGE